MKRLIEDVEGEGLVSLEWGFYVLSYPAIGHVWDFSRVEYRVKPEPLECWINVMDGQTCSAAYMTKEDADEMRPKMSHGWTTRKFREVIE